MLMNNLDPEVAERPEDLIVYGGVGKAARSWDAFHAIVAAPRRLERRDPARAVGQAGRRLTHARSRTDADLERDVLELAGLVAGTDIGVLYCGGHALAHRGSIGKGAIAALARAQM
jgi:hypothetical protein